MGSCTVYKTDKEYIIVTSSKTKDWIWVDDEPIFRVPIENRGSKLIEDVLETLKNSRVDIPNIPVKDMPIFQKKNLKEMGQKSYPSLYKKSNSCSVSEDENGIVTISPYKPYKPGKFSSGLVVANEGVVKVDMNVTAIHELESILIDALNQDYKN
jgi:hypothetical protein